MFSFSKLGEWQQIQQYWSTHCDVDAHETSKHSKRSFGKILNTTPKAATNHRPKQTRKYRIRRKIIKYLLKTPLKNAIRQYFGLEYHFMFRTRRYNASSVIKCSVHQTPLPPSLGPEREESVFRLRHHGRTSGRLLLIRSRARTWHRRSTVRRHRLLMEYIGRSISVEHGRTGGHSNNSGELRQFHP